jgi:hypothetical protein
MVGRTYGKWCGGRSRQPASAETAKKDGERRIGGIKATARTTPLLRSSERNCLRCSSTRRRWTSSSPATRTSTRVSQSRAPHRTVRCCPSARAGADGLQCRPSGRHPGLLHWSTRAQYPSDGLPYRPCWLCRAVWRDPSKQNHDLPWPRCPPPVTGARQVTTAWLPPQKSTCATRVPRAKCWNGDTYCQLMGPPPCSGLRITGKNLPYPGTLLPS